MTIYDSVNKTEVEVDGTKGLIEKMKEGRQVDLYLKEKKSDEDGYMSWDVEHWSSVDGKRFIRCYSLEGRVLSESTGHNIYDLANDFKPEEAAKVELELIRAFPCSHSWPSRSGCLRTTGQSLSGSR